MKKIDLGKFFINLLIGVLWFVGFGMAEHEGVVAFYSLASIVIYLWFNKERLKE